MTGNIRESAPQASQTTQKRNWRPMGLMPITNTRPAFNTPIPTQAQSDRTNSIKGKL